LGKNHLLEGRGVFIGEKGRQYHKSGEEKKLASTSNCQDFFRRIEEIRNQSVLGQ